MMNLEIIHFSLVVGTLFIMIAVFLFIFYRQYRRKQLDFLREKEKLERTHLETQLELAEQTLQHLSQEIHDNIGQQLMLLHIQMQAQSGLEKQSEKLGSIIHELRQLSHHLTHNYVLDLGLEMAMERELNALQSLHGITVVYQNRGLTTLANEKHELIIFRCFQESLTNILKHAKASSIEVKTAVNHNQLTLVITDNGIGFNAEKAMTGIGISNIQKRIQLLNGQYSITPARPNGTTVIFEIPIPLKP